MDTKSIYELIDGERDYQDRRWPGHVHDVPTYLTYIWHYYHKAETAECGSAYESLFDARAAVRKIAALAVACMEQNGAQAPHTLPGAFRPPPLSRAQVYEFVAGEDTDTHEFAAHLALIRYLLTHADDGWSMRMPQTPFALQVVRRIAAVCVRCMEEYETLPRPQWGTR